MTVITTIIEDKSYTIKSMSLGDRQKVFAALNKEGISTPEVMATYISICCVDPKYSITDAMEIDGHIADKLYIECLKQNTVSEDFLLELRKLQLPDSLSSAIKESLEKSKTS